MMPRKFSLLFLTLLALTLEARAFSPGETGFSLRYKNEVSRFQYSPIFLLPGDEVTLRVEENPG
ncbi:MAG TPA: hypothetical protein PLF89_12110, partial [bacterium]|nr:hypothetical protein [bacterium]